MADVCGMKKGSALYLSTSYVAVFQINQCYFKPIFLAIFAGIPSLWR